MGRPHGSERRQQNRSACTDTFDCNTKTTQCTTGNCWFSKAELQKFQLDEKVVQIAVGEL